MPLAAVTERRNQLPLKGCQIGVLLQVQPVTFRFLLHFCILSSAEQQRRVRGNPSCHTPRAVSASRSRAAFALPTPVAFLYCVYREFRGYGRMRIAAAILVVGGILLLISWAPAEAQQAEQQRDDTAGAVWRLVRGGGGLVSPWGTTGVSLQSVTSSGERFVAVGDHGLIAHSSDGNRWVEASFSATDEWLTDVAWGNGRFVAVGGYRIIFSSDGERWVRSRSSDMGSLESVAWSNGRYVAVGGGGTIVRSTDGDRWQRVRNAATRADLSGIAWGGGRFVAVGSGGTIVHSDDGDGWKMASDTGTAAKLYGVAWNGERFVAVGEGTILHSSDGNLWTAAARNPARSSDWLRDVVWSGERFVAVGDIRSCSAVTATAGSGRRSMPARASTASPGTAPAWWRRRGRRNPPQQRRIPLGACHRGRHRPTSPRTRRRGVGRRAVRGAGALAGLDPAQPGR